MLETSARLLRLLSILQTGQDWTAVELANRLGVTTRTVRNDIGRLRELGYHIDSMRGPGGGYWLGRGTTIPPLLLDDEEAVAVAFALRTASGTTVGGIEEPGMRALVKLQQMLPARLQRRVGALEDSVETVPPRTIEVEIDLLMLIATTCRDRQELRFHYTRYDGESTQRQIEPHRVVHTRGHWYLLGWDTERRDWRTFRIDRISDARIRPGPGFRPRKITNAAERVSVGAASALWRYRATVIARAPAETLLRRLPPAVQVEPIDELTCRLHVGSSDPGTLAGYLALLGVDFTLETPESHPELVDQLHSMSERYRRATDTPALPEESPRPP